MCYNVESATLAQLKYALHRGDEAWADELTRRLHTLNPAKFPYFHVSGFAHPKLLVFTDAEPMEPQLITWGYVPYWTKSQADAKKIRTQTLNARGETIFEKPAFRHAAKGKRCLIYLDAFYEHHHAGAKKFPFRIADPDGNPIAVAGLWDEWVNRETGEIYRSCTIVTTSANSLMAKIHNNTKAEMGPRMPAILPREKQDEWLAPFTAAADKEKLQALLKPYDGPLRAYAVRQLLGKNTIGNVPEIREAFHYDEIASLDV